MNERTRIMTWNLNDQEIRRLDSYERLGSDDPHCSNPDCNESDPLTLTGTDPDILCYECRARLQGRSPVERHHPDGQQNSPDTVPIPGNDHRILSDYQKDWPVDTLRNPNESPLLRASAALRGFLNVLQHLIYRILGWIPDFLEGLDDALVRSLGAQWWISLRLEGME
jgi:hypothetical protein